MNRNVSILIVILTIIVISGYLWWLRNQFSQTIVPNSPTPSPAVTIEPYPTVPAAPTASASATPKLTPAKSATPSGTKL